MTLLIWLQYALVLLFTFSDEKTILVQVYESVLNANCIIIPVFIMCAIS